MKWYFWASLVMLAVAVPFLTACSAEFNVTALDASPAEAASGEPTTITAN